ncbi:protein of unknown function DUF371 [Pyrolobus fumarii 1A]|uniref:DUF371 domain-containing protein n=1 Tax=Pyrolobus fumarii (strain DSM 11204 / 1A) TaxID=694429 RepID=G0EED8_PYRF1|nr:protein of unknown function DUF371 [Pyrolobus fumarii 1A]
MARGCGLSSLKTGLIVGTCRGAMNIQASHSSTLEFSSENMVTVRGDCIVCIGLKIGLHKWCEEGKACIEIIVMPPPWRGDKPKRIVIKCLYAGPARSNNLVARRSEYVDSRTLASQCNMAADDIPNDTKRVLADPFTLVYIISRCISSSSASK